MAVLGDSKITKLVIGTHLSTPIIKDRNGSSGTEGQVLSRDATGVVWVNASTLLPSGTLTASSALTSYDMYAHGYRYLTIGSAAYTTSASSNSGTSQATITPSTSDQYVNVSAGYTPKSYIKINKMTNGTWSSNVTMTQGQGASVIGTAGYFPVGYGITGITSTTAGITLSDGTNVGIVAFAGPNSRMMFSGTSGTIDLNDPNGVFVAHNVKNVLAQNIANGVTILGVVGTHAGGITPTGNIELTAQEHNDVYSYATASVRPCTATLNILDVPTSSAGAVTVGTKSGDYYPLTNTLDAGVGVSVTGWLGNDFGGSYTVKVGSMKGAAFTVNGASVKTTSTGAGYVPANTTVGTVATGTAGTPTATIGTAGIGSVNVTPSVTNVTGYITGGTKTGTAVTVYPSNLGLTQRTALTKNGGTVSIPGLSWVSDDALVVTVTPSDVVSGNIELTSASSTDVSAYATATVRTASNFSMTGSAVTDAVTVGTLSSGYYPISAKVKGTITAGTAGWFSTSGATQAATATQVGKIAASVYTTSASSNSGTLQQTITPSASAQYVNISAGYSPKSYVKINAMSIPSNTLTVNSTLSSYDAYGNNYRYITVPAAEDVVIYNTDKSGSSYTTSVGTSTDYNVKIQCDAQTAGWANGIIATTYLKISGGGITPSGNIQLTQQTGTNVTNYATASVRSGVIDSNISTNTNDGIPLITTSGWLNQCFITGITSNGYSINVSDGTNTGTVGFSGPNSRLTFSVSTGTIDLYDPDGHFNAFNVKNVSAGNIASGVTILGVTGTHAGGVIDVSSIATLESNLVAANVGKYYRFTGTSGTSGTGTYYISGNIYTYEA